LAARLWRGSRWQLVIGQNAYDKDALTGFDFVSGGEHGFLDFCPIQKGAVGAFAINHPAAARTTLHGKV